MNFKEIKDMREYMKETALALNSIERLVRTHGSASDVLAYQIIENLIEQLVNQVTIQLGNEN